MVMIVRAREYLTALFFWVLCIFGLPSCVFAETEVSGEISGLAWQDNNGNGIRDEGEPLYSGVPVRIYQLLSTSTLVGSTVTDENGAYSFTGLDLVCNSGTRCRYTVYFDNEDPDNYKFTLQDVGTDDAIDSDVVKRSWGDLASALIILNSETISVSNVDAGFALRSSISGLAWKDNNGNGVRDNSEPFYDGVPIRIYQLLSTSVLVGSAVTDNNGVYSFTDLDVECNDDTRCRYSVYFDNDDADNYRFTLQDVGTDDAVDSDVVKREWGDLASALIVLDANTVRAANVDAGFAPMGRISGLAWKDTDANGLQGGDEPVYSNVPVRIYQLLSTATLLESTVTDDNGAYSFTRFGC